MGGRMIARALANCTTVIVRLDRTIQYAAAHVRLTMPVTTGCLAFAGHDNPGYTSILPSSVMASSMLSAASPKSISLWARPDGIIGKQFSA